MRPCCLEPGKASFWRSLMGQEADRSPFKSAAFERMPKYFTRDQAERLLPKVEKAIRDAVFVKADFQEADQTLRASTRAILMSGGMNVNRERMLEIRQRRDTAA